MSEKKAKIWIDLDNAPHIPFFAPIYHELKLRGYDLLVTASARYQVCELAAMHGMPHQLFDAGYYGKNKFLKTAGIMHRALQLLPALWREKAALAISHGSRSQMVAANMLGIPVVVIMDYEFARFPFVRVDCLITPEVIPETRHANVLQEWKYQGLKEDVYVPEFQPDGEILRKLGVDATKVVATVRPPATDAHYHNAQSEALFERVVQRLAARNGTVMVVLPRNARQAAAITQRWPHLLDSNKMIIPQGTVSGLSLIWESDLVISGGGTMNREAAALGFPVYSIFRGQIGAVDQYLASAGRMTLIESVEDVDRLIQLVKRVRHDDRPNRPNRMLHDIADQLEAVLLENALAEHSPQSADRA